MLQLWHSWRYMRIPEPNNVSCQPGGDCYLLGFLFEFFFSFCTMVNHHCFHYYLGIIFLFAVHFFQASYYSPKDPDMSWDFGISPINPIILLWGWECFDHQSYNREGSGFLGSYNSPWCTCARLEAPLLVWKLHSWESSKIFPEAPS